MFEAKVTFKPELSQSAFPKPRAAEHQRYNTMDEKRPC